jgi:hypothetical protein
MDKMIKIRDIAKAQVELLSQKDLIELATEMIEAELLEEPDDVIEALFEENKVEDDEDEADGFRNEAHYQAYRNGAI